MSDPSSELVEISKLNGDFKRNYGKLIGALLYLRSINAARLFNPLECVCTCHSLLGLLAANTMLASAEMECPAPNVQQRFAKAADKMV